jgi:hypothetical protein
MISETTQAEIFMSLVAMKLPEDVLLIRLKQMLSEVKQSGLDAGYDQALIDRNEAAGE